MGPLQFIDETYDEFSIGIKKGGLNYRGKREIANLTLGNSKLGEIHDFSLRLKFMYRRIEVPEESSWTIMYIAENKETGEREADLDISFRHAFGLLVEPGVVFILFLDLQPSIPNLG